jgi:hypothetical protein
LVSSYSYLFYQKLLVPAFFLRASSLST